MANKKELVDLGVHRLWLDESENVCVECFLCSSIRYAIIEHLEEEHRDNPVAQRIVSEYRKAFGSGDEL